MGRSGRLLSWYRVIPLACVLVFGVVSYGYTFGPALLFRALYPLSYESEITSSASSHGVDPYLVAAIISSESGWDADAVSHQGAQGLMQLMPETASDMVRKGLVDGERYDPSNLDDPETNIEFGCAYLSYLLSYFNGATDKAVAAYNAGMGNVDIWTQQDSLLHNAITFPETQAYLVRVMMAQSRYRELYPQAFS